MNRLEEWVLSVKRLLGWPDPVPVCVVCGDDLKGEEQLRHHHCRNCWPSYLKQARPPIRTLLGGSGRR